jgi:hypothetical protein
VFDVIRREPPQADPNIKALFLSVANDPFFQRIARLSLEQQLRLTEEVERASFRRSPWFQGGYAGRDRGGNLVLGLSRWFPAAATAAHEAFHVARDIRGKCPLSRPRVVTQEEPSQQAPPPPLSPPDRQPSFWRVWWEEVVVWCQTAIYAPVGTFLIWSALSFILVLAFTVAFLLSSFLSSLLLGV